MSRQHVDESTWSTLQHLRSSALRWHQTPCRPVVGHDSCTCRRLGSSATHSLC